MGRPRPWRRCRYYLEGQLGDDGFLAGGQFSIADIAVDSMLRQYRIAGETIDATRWPKLAAYGGRIEERACFHSAAEAEDAMAQCM